MGIWVGISALMLEPLPKHYGPCPYSCERDRCNLINLYVHFGSNGSAITEYGDFLKVLRNFLVYVVAPCCPRANQFRSNMPKKFIKGVLNRVPLQFLWVYRFRRDFGYVYFFVLFRVLWVEVAGWRRSMSLSRLPLAPSGLEYLCSSEVLAVGNAVMAKIVVTANGGGHACWCGWLVLRSESFDVWAIKK